MTPSGAVMVAERRTREYMARRRAPSRPEFLRGARFERRRPENRWVRELPRVGAALGALVVWCVVLFVLAAVAGAAFGVVALILGFGQ